MANPEGDFTPRPLFGGVYRIERDGFEGTIIGTYTTREGSLGYVLQQLNTKVVHVYRATHLRAVEPARG